MITPVSRHLDLYRGFITTYVSFIVQDKIIKNTRGGNWDKKILQK